MSKNILVLAGGNQVSGAERVTLDVLSCTQKAGYHFHCIINGWNDGDFKSRLEALNITYSELKLGWFYLSKPLWTLASLIHLPIALFRFVKVIKNKNIDLIYAIHYRPVILLYPFLKHQILYHAHDQNSDSKLSKFVIQTIDKKIKMYVAVSEFIKQDLIKCGVSPAKIVVIYNGVALPEEAASIQKKSNVLNIGIIGQIIPRKGHEDVVNALKLLIDKGISDVQLRIIGKGDQVFIDSLKQQIGVMNLVKHVEWVGYMKNLLEIYQGLDIVVAPTRNNEPFGLIAIEANAYGIPVIVSNTGGLAEIVEEGYNGWKVNAFAPSEIAERIEHCYHFPDEIATIGQNGKIRVSQLFSKSKMIECIEKEFAACLAH